MITLEDWYISITPVNQDIKMPFLFEPVWEVAQTLNEIRPDLEVWEYQPPHEKNELDDDETVYTTDCFGETCLHDPKTGTDEMLGDRHFTLHYGYDRKVQQWSLYNYGFITEQCYDYLDKTIKPKISEQDYNELKNLLHDETNWNIMIKYANYHFMFHKACHEDVNNNCVTLWFNYDHQ